MSSASGACRERRYAEAELLRRAAAERRAVAQRLWQQLAERDAPRDEEPVTAEGRS